MDDLLFWYINNIKIIDNPLFAILGVIYLVSYWAFFISVYEGEIDLVSKFKGKLYTCWIVGIVLFPITVPFCHIILLIGIVFLLVEFMSSAINE